MLVNKKGRGYIGNSMSVNAKIAHSKGMKPISNFSSGDLKELGFLYPYTFFKWLVNKNYIVHKEMHHTSASKQYTKFYGEDTIKFVVKNFNLDLLYKIYKGEISKEEAKRERGIKYVRVRTLDSVFRVNKGNILNINCIKCDNIIWYSPKVAFPIMNERSEILEEFSERPSVGFENEYLSKVSELLLKRKTSSLFDRIR